MAKQTSEWAWAWRTAGLLLYVPLILAVAPLAGYFLGDWLDRRFGIGSWTAWLGILLGFVVAGRQIYHIVRRVQRDVAGPPPDRKP